MPDADEPRSTVTALGHRLRPLMFRNVGLTDRFLRVLIGTFLVSTAVIGQLALGWVGIYPLLTGIFATSPIYLILGIRTAAPRPSAR